MTPKNYQFLKTAQGSRDGLSVTTFPKGSVHPLDESLAEQFFHQGVVTETAAQPSPSSDKAGEAGVPPRTRRIEELVSVARDHYGLTVDSTMDPEVVRRMIETAKGGAASRETKVTGPEETKPATAAEHKQPAVKGKLNGRKVKH